MFWGYVFEVLDHVYCHRYTSCIVGGGATESVKQFFQTIATFFDHQPENETIY